MGWTDRQSCVMTTKLDSLSRSDWINLIDEWIIGRNAERDRAILKRRLLDGLTYEKLAEEFDMSVRQIKNIVYKGTSRLMERV